MDHARQASARPGEDAGPARLCARCALPETFPGARFDAAGVCQWCRMAPSAAEAAEERVEARRRFEDLAARLRGRSGHDVVMAFSGGKDSTYTLWLFGRVWGLRVLAVTVDNGFVAAGALDNMRRVTETLGADHVLLRPNPKALRALFRASAERDIHPAKALERASSVCSSCIAVIKGLMLKIALEAGAPFIGWGWSPGQAPVKASVMRPNPRFAVSAQRALREPLRLHAGDAVDGWFPSEARLAEAELPWNVHPLAFVDYAEAEVLRRIEEFGWVKPNDTDPNSSNCLLNTLGNALHQKRLGFHPYAMEIAGLVRSGCLSREEGARKLSQPADPVVLERVRDQLYADAPAPADAARRARS